MQHVTCIMSNDTSQRSVATWFRFGGTFDHYCIQIYCRLLGLFWKNF